MTTRVRRSAGPRGRAGGPIRYRPAEAADLPACAEVWRDGINDYIGRLNLPLVPAETGPVARLHAHIRATDPDRFWVATRAGRDGSDGKTIVGFTAATRRDDVSFLSMLFVRPGEQGAGVGRALLERSLPPDGTVLATATDSAQPISNGLYAALGIVPRMPLLSLVGRPGRPNAFGDLPSGIRVDPFEAIAARSGGSGQAGLTAALDALDREVAGFAHPQDHAFVRGEGRLGFLFRGPDGAAVGYGYASAVGRVGPVAVRDEALLGPILGHLLTAVVPRGASALWVPGLADRAVVPLLRAGLRLEGFPVLLCWSRPFGDFRRYLPTSPGLL